MIDFDTMGDWLDEIAEQFPPEFYAELNGGIALLPEASSSQVSHPSFRLAAKFHSFHCSSSPQKSLAAFLGTPRNR